MKIFRYLLHPRFILSFLLRKTVIRKFVSDETYVKLNYFLLTGEKLNLTEPKSFREKIQWLKLNNRRPEFTKMVDKVAAKEYASKIIGERYIIPTLAVFDDIESIDISSLPSQFVMKTTNGGGSNGVIICRDKTTFDFSKAKRQLRKSLKTDIYLEYREWVYKDVEKKILVEKYMEDENVKDLNDYKFFCFNGKARYVQVIQNRSSRESIDFFDMNWNHQDFVGLNPLCENSTTLPCKPKNFDLMIEIANKLSSRIPFLRVDLYEINGLVYFGEMTFYPNSGIGCFNPPVYDSILGDLIDIDGK